MTTSETARPAALRSVAPGEGGTIGEQGPRTTVPTDGAPGEAGATIDSFPGPGAPQTAPKEPAEGATTTVRADEPLVTDAGSDGVSTPLVAVLLLVALFIGLALGYAMRTFGSTPPPPLPPRPAPVPPAANSRPWQPQVGAGAGAGAGGWPRERTNSPVPAAQPSPLVSAAIEVRDRVTNRALADQLGAGLAAAGLTTIDPTGGIFDPTCQTSVDRQPTSDPALENTIATVERVGYRDTRGQVVRPPEVVVYRYEPIAAPEAGR